MKRVINIIVSIVFLISFIGIQVHKHYSHGKLYSSAIYTEAESCCENMETCEMAKVPTTGEHQKSDDCSCKDETETFKLSTNFIANKRQKMTETPVLDVLIIYVSIIYIQVKVLNNNIPFIDISPSGKSLNTQSEFGVFLC